VRCRRFARSGKAASFDCRHEHLRRRSTIQPRIVASEEPYREKNYHHWRIVFNEIDDNLDPWSVAAPSGPADGGIWSRRVDHLDRGGFGKIVVGVGREDANELQKK